MDTCSKGPSLASENAGTLGTGRGVEEAGVGLSNERQTNRKDRGEREDREETGERRETETEGYVCICVSIYPYLLL